MSGVTVRDFGKAFIGFTFALAACDGAGLDATGDGAATTPVTAVAAYAGPVGDSDLALALTLHDRDIMAYVCGGATTYASYTRWFTGRIADDGSMTLTREGWTLRITAIGAWVEGALVGPRGETIDFDVSRVSAPYGLYRSAAGDGACATGLVLWDEDGSMATQGAWCDGAGRFGQVTPIAPMPVDAAGKVAVRRLAFDSTEPQLLVPMPAAR